MARWQCDYERAVTLSAEAAALYEELGDLRAVASTLHTRGWVRFAQIRYAEAAAYDEASLALAEPIGAELIRVGALVSLAQVLGDSGGDLERAEQMARDGLTRCRERSLLGFPVAAQSVPGVILQLHGDLAGAEGQLREMIATAREHGHAGAVSAGLVQLAAVRQLDDDDDAGSAVPLGEAFPTLRDRQDWRFVAAVMELTAGVAVALGAGRPAAALLGAAESCPERIGAPTQGEFRQPRDRNRANAVRRLGAAGFAAAWAEGQSWPFEHALAETGLVLNAAARLTGAR